MNPIIHTNSLLRRTTLAALLAAGAATGATLADSSVTLSLVPSAPSVLPGELLTVTVRMDVSTPEGEGAATILGAQVAARFDATLLEPVSTIATEVVMPDGSGPFPSLNPGCTVDPVTGGVCFFVLDPVFAGTSESGVIAALHFRVKHGASVCSVAELVRFDTVSGNDTTLAVLSGAAATLSLANLPPVNLDHVAPGLTVVPTEVTVAADAGSTYGAAVAQPSIVATDNCDGDVAVSLSAALADGTTVTSWPAAFPIGVNVVTWTATDDAGNNASQAQTITVENVQLVDATVKLSGAVSPDASITERAVRLRAGASTAVYTVEFLPVTRSENHVCHIGLIQGARIPVAAGYECISAKDAGHSLTASAPATDAGVRYETSIQLVQGDSNNDDLIDIVDFSMFVLDLGAATSDGRSNFNADGVVDSADFSHIGINMLRRGEGCTGFAAGNPKTRVSLKELRRAGLGHLAAADLDGDGWIDQRDIATFLERGGPARPSEERLDRRNW